MRKSKVSDLVYMAMFVALLAVCSWICIPMTVPVTLQTFAVFTAVAVQVTLLCPGFVKTDIFRSQPHVAGSEKLLNAIAADADRIARGMLQAIRCGRGYKVLGVDGHLLSIGMRLCPTLTLRLCRDIIKASNLPLFADIWAD